ncbi:MAG: 50S ribosome-binding GTPase [Isosphaeraceae bacterium]|nr:50S ribosome-binding GTPase [Isosphaeraceae bacterium]
MSPNDPVNACQRLIRLLEATRSVRERARLSTDDSIHPPITDFALALLKMRVAPALETTGPESDPVHVVLFGGTNTGKSTVLNVLLGRPAAGMNVLARFSQHPEAYRPALLGDHWLVAHPTRFHGYERFHGTSPPRQLDASLQRDGYRPCLAIFDTQGIANPLREPFSTNAVAWDAPDFSTEEALTHLETVLDIAALADVVVMTVSDESYADDRGHALLRMLGESGATLYVVANKFPESTSQALLDDLAETLRVSARVCPAVHRFRQVRAPDPEARLRGLIESPEAEDLRRVLAREVERVAELKHRTLRGALSFIQTHWQELVRPLAEEADLAARWGEIAARTTRETVLEPYRRDYLEGLNYGDFNRALAELMQLLQVPGIGPALDFAGRIVRWPGRMLARAFGGLAKAGSGNGSPPSERSVLERAIDRWLVALKAEAELLAGSAAHPGWNEIIRVLDDGGFRAAVREPFETAFAAYQQELDAMIRQRADALYAQLKESPKRLNALRAANLATNVLSIGVVVKLGGLHWWDAVLGPAVVGLNQTLVERGFGKLLDNQREGLKHDQFRSVTALIVARLEQPSRALFQGATRAGSLDEAERDFAAVRDAIARRAEGATK